MTELAFILLILFGLKHFVSDFLLQFDYMVAEKGIYGAIGGLHHAFIHGIFTFLILVWVCPNPYMAMFLSATDFVIHYHIDWAKQQLNRNLSVNDRMWWVCFGLDQAAHYLTYVGIIYVAIG